MTADHSKQKTNQEKNLFDLTVQSMLPLLQNISYIS